jgi:hypothetical protein
VAILGVSHRWRHLHFVVPEVLKNVGFIPLSSKSALAARTTRESRPETVNDFTSVRHASVFEGAKLAAETAEVIQKIISAPILCGDRVVGVIQIRRKGANVKAAGTDFTSDALGKVLSESSGGAPSPNDKGLLVLRLSHFCDNAVTSRPICRQTFPQTSEMR